MLSISIDDILHPIIVYENLKFLKICFKIRIWNIYSYILKTLRNMNKFNQKCEQFLVHTSDSFTLNVIK